MKTTKMAMAALLTVWLVAGGSAPTRGQDVSPRSKDEINRLSELARQAAEKGKLEEAVSTWLDLLDEAAADEAVWNMHVNLALAYKMLKRLPEAWHHVTIYLRNVGKEDRSAGKMLQDLERKMTEADLRKVDVTCTPAAAKVYLGARVEGPPYPCPLTWWFKPEQQFVTVAAEGFVTQTVDMDLMERGGRASWTVVLQEVERYGTLEVQGSGDAFEVFLNGTLQGGLPFSRKLKTGSYELNVVKQGGQPWMKTVVIEADKTVIEAPPDAQAVAGSLPGDVTQPGGVAGLAADVRKAKSKTRGRRAAIGLLAGGLGTVVVGGALSLVGYAHNEDLYDEFEGEPDRQRKYEDAYDKEVSPYKTASAVVYAVGGATAAAGLVWLVVDSVQKKKRSSVVVSPWLGPHGGGGTFAVDF